MHAMSAANAPTLARRAHGVLRAVAVVASVAGLVSAASSCGPRYPTPFSAESMAQVGTSSALVHYLKQPGATAAVCDARATSAHVSGDTLRDVDTLVHGVGEVSPIVFQRCVALMLESSSPEARARILEALVHEYRAYLGKSAVETDAAEKARLEALHRTLLLRPRGAEPRDAAIAEDIAALRKVLASQKLGPTATQLGKDMLSEVDLVAGTYEGKPMTAAVVDGLFAKGDETMLFRIANHAKSEELRRGARLAIVKLHVRASKSPEVAAQAGEVEARVMATGRNTVDLEKTPPSSGWIDDAKVGFRGIRVRQDLWKQVSDLLPLDKTKTVIPSVTLRGALFVRVPGYSDPLTVCAHPEALDVTPCIDAHTVRPRVPILTVDEQGLMHVVERIATADALKLVYNTENLPIPVDVAGKPVITIEWPIHFDAPEPIVLEGPMSSRGPDIRVSIERRYSPRLLFAVEGPNGKWRGVIENDDLSKMAIVSRGGAGKPGTRGTDGAAGGAGSAGSNASCPGALARTAVAAGTAEMAPRVGRAALVAPGETCTPSSRVSRATATRSRSSCETSCGARVGTAARAAMEAAVVRVARGARAARGHRVTTRSPSAPRTSRVACPDRRARTAAPERAARTARTAPRARWISASHKLRRDVGAVVLCGNPSRCHPRPRRRGRAPVSLLVLAWVAVRAARRGARALPQNA